jgi:hypothetical protein
MSELTQRNRKEQDQVYNKSIESINTLERSTGPEGGDEMAV